MKITGIVVKQIELRSSRCEVPNFMALIEEWDAIITTAT
jgi:hypothetical protein